MPHPSYWSTVRTSLAEFEFPAMAGPLAAQAAALEWQLARSERWPPDLMRRRQFEQLARLVRVARERAPFYAERLRHLSGDDGISERAWSSIPVLTREEIQSNAARLATGIENHGRTAGAATSGSSGVPIEVVQTEAWQLLLSAAKWRFFGWHGYDFRGKMAEIRALRGAPPGVVELRHAHWDGPPGALFETGPRIELDIFADVETQLAWLEREAPAYLLSLPSNLGVLARTLRRTGRRLPSLRLVRGFGERFDEELQAECRAGFGVPAIDLYGSVECGYIAIQCPDSGLYHVQSELNLVEVLDEAGAPCGPGAVGRVVVTPLHAFAMPLLRYDIGDYAEPAESCRCGRRLPVLRRIHGRRNDLLTLPSGEKRFATFASRIYGPLAAVARFQIVQ